MFLRGAPLTYGVVIMYSDTCCSVSSLGVDLITVSSECHGPIMSPMILLPAVFLIHSEYTILMCSSIFLLSCDYFLIKWQKCHNGKIYKEWNWPNGVWMVLVNLGVVQLCQADHLKGFRRSNIQSHLVLGECSSALRQVPTQKQYSSNVVPFFRVVRCTP
jgi:hypothetical protein